MQNITCSVFFPRGFVFILRAWSSSKHMHTCNACVRLRLGTVGLVKDVQTVSVQITFQSFVSVCVCVCVCVGGCTFDYEFSVLRKPTECTTAGTAPNGSAGTYTNVLFMCAVLELQKCKWVFCFSDFGRIRTLMQKLRCVSGA